MTAPAEKRENRNPRQTMTTRPTTPGTAAAPPAPAYPADDPLSCRPILLLRPAMLEITPHWI